MNKDAINPIFIITLAIIPLVSIASTLNEAAFLALIVSFTYIISCSIVSTLEHLVDRNLRFFVLIILAAAIVSVLSYIFAMYPNVLYVGGATRVNYCLVSVGILSLQIIYNDSKKDVVNYFYKLLIQVPVFIVMYLGFAFMREILAFGSIWGMNMGYKGVEFFRTTSGAFMLLALLSGFINAHWLSLTKKRQQYNLLVEKYKMKINLERNYEREVVIGVETPNIIKEQETDGEGFQENDEDKALNDDLAVEEKVGKPFDDNLKENDKISNNVNEPSFIIGHKNDSDGGGQI